MPSLTQKSIPFTHDTFSDFLWLGISRNQNKDSRISSTFSAANKKVINPHFSRIHIPFISGAASKNRNLIHYEERCYYSFSALIFLKKYFSLIAAMLMQLIQASWKSKDCYNVVYSDKLQEGNQPFIQC